MLINILNRELEGNIKSLLIKFADDTIFILPLAGRGININDIQAAMQRHLGCLVNKSLPPMIFRFSVFGSPNAIIYMGTTYAPQTQDEAQDAGKFEKGKCNDGFRSGTDRKEACVILGCITREEGGRSEENILFQHSAFIGLIAEYNCGIGMNKNKEFIKKNELGAEKSRGNDFRSRENASQRET